MTKVPELEGALLDYWVARAAPECEGLRIEWRGDHWVGIGEIDGADEVVAAGAGPNFAAAVRLRTRYKLSRYETYRPSSVWSDGGPIIERERVTVMSPKGGRFDWLAEIIQGEHFAFQNGPTPLIAAMRAYVASKFGEDVPDAPTP